MLLIHCRWTKETEDDSVVDGYQVLISRSVYEGDGRSGERSHVKTSCKDMFASASKLSEE